MRSFCEKLRKLSFIFISKIGESTKIGNSSFFRLIAKSTTSMALFNLYNFQLLFYIDKNSISVEIFSHPIHFSQFS